MREIIMAFSDFKNIAQVQTRYKIKFEEKLFITSGERLLSAGFIEDLKFNQKNIDIFTSEASRCEIIISPLL